MGLDWECIPHEFLLPAIRLLSPEDASRAAAVNRKWREIAIDERVWRRHVEQVFLWSSKQPKLFPTFFHEFSFFKNRIPRTVSTVIDDYGYVLRHVVFSPNGKFLAVSGLPAHICIYEASSMELLDERSFADSLQWESIEAVQFSPNSHKLLLSGLKPNSSEELVVLEISEDPHEVHFLCRTPCAPNNFHGCWFDDEHLLISEIYQFGFRSPIASSLSQLYLFSLPTHRNAPSDFYPLLRFLNRRSPIRLPLVANTASPRFRRVVQLSQQAKQENKTLSEKVSELELSGAVNIQGDLTELREVLDKEQQCFRCYLKHQLTSPEYGTEKPLECHCVCHQIIHRLLMFVIEDAEEEKIGFKLIETELLNDALNMRRFQVDDKGEDPADLWDFVARRVDEPDHVIPVGGSVSSMKMSPDQRQLFVTVQTDEGFKIRCIDLDKMINDPIGIHWRVAVDSECMIDVGDTLIVGIREGRLTAWSRHHLGISIGDVEAMASNVAVHPSEEHVVTSNDMELYIWNK